MDAAKPILRWYRLTPDRLILGLLAVEVSLLVSQWGDWFEFNHHKGWTVLIAVAAVGVVSLLLVVWLTVSLLFRWRFPILASAPCCCSSWLSPLHAVG